jgi:arsenite/tail-anchored protein-transporting ATPase
MRIILFTGKGGVGKTTIASATAVRLADRGTKTLLVSTDSAHSIADALGGPIPSEPAEVMPGLSAVQVQTQQRFERAWSEIQAYLLQVMARSGLDPITAEELTVLPGIEEVLALMAVGDFARSDRWDAIILDCAPTAETLRLLALPEAVGWYLNRVFPVHRALARGMRPLASILGRGEALPPDGVMQAALHIADELAAVRTTLVDPAITSLRLVLTPEAMVIAEARRMLTALCLYGYRVDGVVANRVFPAGDDASDWHQSWVASQSRQLSELGDSFGTIPVRQVQYRAGEPTGPAGLRAVAADLYGQPGVPSEDPAEVALDAPSLMDVSAQRTEYGDLFVLTMLLPGVNSGDVEASRSGADLIVTVGGYRRILTLPSVLRRCIVEDGSVSEGTLRLQFRPDPDLWPAG